MAKMYVRRSATEPHEMFAYGDPWVLFALFADDIKFETREEAIAWWNQFLKDNPDYGSEGDEDVYYGNETESF